MHRLLPLSSSSFPPIFGFNSFYHRSYVTEITSGKIFVAKYVTNSREREREKFCILYKINKDETKEIIMPFAKICVTVQFL